MSPRFLARSATLGLAVLLTTASLAAADIPDDAALPDDALAAQRVAGGDRYETAARTALEAHPDGASTAIVARGDEFPDGLASAYLAGVRNAPILLTRPDRLPHHTLDAFEVLGTQRVVVVGGPNAISPAVEDRLNELFGESNVNRVNGGTRFETAAFVAQTGGVFGAFPDLSGDTGGTLPTAIVVSGRNFPDALAAGPLAHAANLPILLTEPGNLPGITRIALEGGAEQVIVAGGPVSVSGQVLTQLGQVDGVQGVHRVAGDDRTATAVALADLTTEHLDWPGATVTVSLGTDFPDALSLAPAAARSQAPILLARSTTEVGASTFAAIQDRCETLTDVLVSGGEVAIAASTERQIELATSCADHLFPLSDNEVVGSAGDPTGVGVGWLWTDSLCYGLRVRGVSSDATTAALFLGDAGENGDRIATLDAPAPPTGDGLSVGCLTDDEVDGDATAYEDLKAALQEHPSDFYVRVDTRDHPEGAIRGQVAPTPEE